MIPSTKRIHSAKKFVKAATPRFRKTLLKIGATACTVSLLVSSSFAVTGTVTTDTLRFREKPSVKKSAVIALLDKNDTVTILSDEPLSNKAGDWYKVSHDGDIGYISADYLTLAGDTYQDRYAVVAVERLNLRAEANTECEVLRTLEEGDEVELIGDVPGGWYKVEFDGVEGFIKSEFLNAESGSASDSADSSVQTGKYGIVSTARLNLREDPSTDANVLSVLTMKTVVKIKSIEDEWAEISADGISGYVSAEFLKQTNEAPASIDDDDDDVSSNTGRTNSNDDDDDDAPAATSKPQSSNSSSDSNKSSSGSSKSGVLSTAYGKLGATYRYGAAGSTAFDCSGFTSWVYRQNGVYLPHSSAEQYRVSGSSVSKSDLQPGDLVFFSRGGKSVGHVGIYVGDGDFIHASNPSDGVKVTSLSSSYYASSYVGAKRVG